MALPRFANEATTQGLPYDRGLPRPVFALPAATWEPSLREGLPSRSRRSLRGVCRGPSSPFGLRRGTLRYERACRAEAGVACEGWWSQAGSNRRPLACHASALPAELWPLKDPARLGRLAGRNPDHKSGPISSLLVAANVANDVGNVFVAFFLVGDEG